HAGTVGASPMLPGSCLPRVVFTASRSSSRSSPSRNLPRPTANLSTSSHIGASSSGFGFLDQETRSGDWSDWATESTQTHGPTALPLSATERSFRPPPGPRIGVRRNDEGYRFTGGSTPTGPRSAQRSAQPAHE